jgi:hypothetical protein
MSDALFLILKLGLFMKNTCPLLILWVSILYVPNLIGRNYFTFFHEVDG